jgi:hypothetical protein
MTTACLQTRYGAGNHITTLPTLVPFLKLTYVGVIFYHIFQWATKMSLAFLYLRIFTPQGRTRYAIYTLMAFLSISQSAFLFITVFACTPVALAWDKTLKGQCLDINPCFFASTFTSICTDLVLIMIALPPILQLKLRLPSKIGLLAVVNLGWVTIAACIVRTVKLRAMLTTPDFTWHAFDFVIWAGLECCTLMICVAAPVIKPLLKKIFGSSRDNSETKTSGGSDLGQAWSGPTFEAQMERGELKIQSRNGSVISEIMDRNYARDDLPQEEDS